MSFSKGPFYVGMTPDLGIVSDKGKSTDGDPTKTYDASDKEKWTASEQYKGGRADNGFVLVYEIKS